MFSRYTHLRRLEKDYYGLRRITEIRLEFMVSVRRRRRFQAFLDKMFGWYNEPKKRQRKLKIFMFNDMLHQNNSMKRTKKHTNYNIVDRTRKTKILDFFLEDTCISKFKSLNLDYYENTNVQDITYNKISKISNANINSTQYLE